MRPVSWRARGDPDLSSLSRRNPPCDAPWHRPESVCRPVPGVRTLGSLAPHRSVPIRPLRCHPGPTRPSPGRRERERHTVVPRASHSHTDPLTRTVRVLYDPAGRVTTQILPDLREIHTTYDANGNVASITPPTKPGHLFDYTPVDLEASYTPAGPGYRRCRDDLHLQPRQAAHPRDPPRWPDPQPGLTTPPRTASYLLACAFARGGAVRRAHRGCGARAARTPGARCP